MLEFKLSDGQKHEVALKGDQFIIDQQEMKWDWLAISDRHFHILYRNKSYRVDIISVNKEEKTVRLSINEKQLVLAGKNKMDLLLEELGLDTLKAQAFNDLKAPMPGLILDIHVTEGQEVKKGDKLLVLEAMKMENVIKAPADLTIGSIKISQGENVEKNHILITFA